MLILSEYGIDGIHRINRIVLPDGSRRDAEIADEGL
jgi:hypothetical protein